MTPVVEASGLVKRFGDVRALDGLDLVAEPGRVVAGHYVWRALAWTAGIVLVSGAVAVARFRKV
ncbi:hypothetical protein [Actinomadura coerulea]|uniref:hypothetical protein n=1 Tax=Actinomadura coerulea TaxID=46159 RepID=UPI00341DE7E8